MAHSCKLAAGREGNLGSRLPGGRLGTLGRTSLAPRSRHPHPGKSPSLRPALLLAPPRYRYSTFSNLTEGRAVKPREGERSPPRRSRGGQQLLLTEAAPPRGLRPAPRPGAPPAGPSATDGGTRLPRGGLALATLPFGPPAAGEEPLLLKGKVSPARGDEEGVPRASSQGSARLGTAARPTAARYSTARHGMARYGTVRYGTVRYGTVRYGTVQRDSPAALRRPRSRCHGDRSRPSKRGDWPALTPTRASRRALIGRSRTPRRDCANGGAAARPPAPGRSHAVVKPAAWSGDFYHCFDCFTIVFTFC
ncbi:uncharacterized protein [Patagioenas fasciata]|uniref:uncharacterized protein n=1 Tax=Patagioenas fasciata TaxID=372321 RepID=UPI003A99FE12